MINVQQIKPEMPVDSAFRCDETACDPGRFHPDEDGG